MTLSQAVLIKIAIAAMAVVFWLWTQKLLGKRLGYDSQRIHDYFLKITEKFNSYLHTSPGSVRLLLISSSLIIDILGVGLIISGIWGKSIQPLLGLILLFSLRQVSQAVTLLPIPQGLIWKSPKFPSLFVTYGVSNDLFFSGHTALATYGALYFSQDQGLWASLAAVLIVAYEVFVVIILRAHWTMDIIAGLFAAFWINELVQGLSPFVDAWLNQL